MSRPSRRQFTLGLYLLPLVALIAGGLYAQNAPNAQRNQNDQPAQEALEEGETTLPGRTYSHVVIEESFEQILEADVAEREEVLQRQQELLERRYDLSDQPSEVMMSAGRKPVQRGVRVKLHGDVTWEELAQMTPEEIKEQDLWPMGFRPLPHVKHQTGGMVFPQNQIDEIERTERRDLARFDVEFDLPDHLTPEFPPPLFLTTHPEMGDVTQGQVLTIKNFHELLDGKVTPVQMEGMRLLLTPFPQQQFNTTTDRKVLEPSHGVTCLDCHVNGHTNAAFHLNPDTRPQEDRFRIETPSLRGLFNQKIHGSKRSLRSIEDFTEFEQRSAYFDGDPVTAAKKGVNVLERGSQVMVMGQMQAIFDFPPAPKLRQETGDGRLRRDMATEQELLGEEIFFGKGRCADCHTPPGFLDDKMHDLHLERFYEAGLVNGQHNKATGPIKTTTLRGIKDSPPYLHDGRLLTLDDTVEFFNFVLELQLTQEEKDALVAYMLCL